MDFSQVKYDPNAFRGAFNLTPSPGSSNLTGAIPLAGGSYASQLLQQIQGSPELSAGFKTDPFGTILGVSSLYQLDPSTRKQERKEAIEDQLAYAKQLGDQQMKYNLINRGMTALQTGLERGLTKYQDPYTIANMIAGGYAEGARASVGLANLGAGLPATKYYSV